MLKIVLVACLVAVAFAQQVHRPHFNHDSMEFFEDKQMGDLVMVSHSHCYLYALSDAEKKDINNPEKMFSLELQLVALVNDAKFSDVTDRPDRLLNVKCRGKTIQLVAA